MSKLYSVKEIAEITGLTKPGIQKAINKDPAIKCDKEKNKKRLYSPEKVKEIIERLSIDIDYSFLDLETTENQELNTTENNSQLMKTTENEQEPTSENSPTEPKTEANSELEFMKDMLEVIKAQLQEKDQQIAIKDQQIKDLSDRLAEAMQLTRGQQYIAAADKTTEMIEADNNRSYSSTADCDTEKEEKKEGFFKRLFKR